MRVNFREEEVEETMDAAVKTELFWAVFRSATAAAAAATLLIRGDGFVLIGCSAPTFNLATQLRMFEFAGSSSLSIAEN